MDSTLFADKSCSIQRKIIFNVLCYSEVNDLFTGSHYSLFQPLGHGFLVCWACKRGKKGNSHTLNECGLDLNEDARRFHTWSTLQSFVLFHISWEEKKYIVFTCHTEQQLSCQPANPNPSSPPPPATFFATFVSFSPQNLPFLLVTWLSGSRGPLCPCV